MPAGGLIIIISEELEGLGLQGKGELLEHVGDGLEAAPFMLGNVAIAVAID